MSKKEARAKAEAMIESLLSEFAGKNESVDDTVNRIKALNDRDFDAYMHKLKDGTEILPYIVPPLNKKIRVSTEKNLKIAKKLKHNFFERLWLTDQATGITSLTPLPYLVVDMPLKRLQQHWRKKIAIPRDNRSVDSRTGQVAGKSSKASALSAPELQVLYSQGYVETIRELFKVRGGDQEMYRRLVANAQTGQLPSMNEVDDGSTRPKVIDVVSVMLTCAGIDNNL